MTVRGPVTDLLLALYHRRPVDGRQIDGDAALLEHWLAQNAFG